MEDRGKIAFSTPYRNHYRSAVLVLPLLLTASSSTLSHPIPNPNTASASLPPHNSPHTATRSSDSSLPASPASLRCSSFSVSRFLLHFSTRRRSCGCFLLTGGSRSSSLFCPHRRWLLPRGIGQRIGRISWVLRELHPCHSLSMEEFGGNHFKVMSGVVRRRRTQRFRRPQSDSYAYDEGNEASSLSPAPPSDDASKGSSDETVSGETNFKRKEFNLNQCVHVSSSVGTEAEESLKNLKEDDGPFDALYNNNELGHGGIISRRSSEGVLAPANWKSSSWQNGESQTSGQSGASLDGSGSESKVKKVKLKVGSVTRTISTSNGASETGISERVKQNAQGISGHGNSPSDKRSGLKGIPWKDFSRGGIIFGREHSAMGKITGKNVAGKQGDKSEPVRKSKRMPKKRVLDGDFDDDEDEEIRYLEKLKASRISMGNKEFDEDSGRKQRKLASVSDIERQGSFKAGKDAKRKTRADRVFEDADYEEEEEMGSDGEVEGKKKMQKKESVDYLMDNSKREITLTTRQRALQSSKDTSMGQGSSLIEFPNGLPPIPPRKQKEKLSEVEQQLKKAEAAQRRKIQNEKAARESEAEAIRKILGQDSNRKKREEKMKKRQEALAEEKAANASMLSSSTVRWVMGPSGTVVIFPNEMGLPKIFDSKPCSYPPPRENCAGPSCPNPYKYRDSKTKLPLCSLQCYKAVQQKVQSEAIC